MNCILCQIDIEAHEFTEGGFDDWITSGALENVGQIALELHVNYDQSDERYHCDHTLTSWTTGYDIIINCRQFIKLLLQDLYKLRFRVISHEPNMVVGPRSDGSDGSFYTFLEVVLMKQQFL